MTLLASADMWPRRQHLPEVPVRAADARWSVVSSAVDQPAPDPDLIQLLLDAGTAAASASPTLALSRVSSDEQRDWLQCWPGEHYRLLIGLVRVLKPRTVVEIGTWTGLGALALAEELDPQSRLVTYDILPWDQIPNTALRADDLAGGPIEQRLADLSDPTAFNREIDVLRSADLIFCDAPKDGRFEPAFLRLAVPALADRRRLLVFDDIRLLEMVSVWRELALPKIDATSIGHWSGTGLAFTV